MQSLKTVHSQSLQNTVFCLHQVLFQNCYCSMDLICLEVVSSFKCFVVYLWGKNIQFRGLKKQPKPASGSVIMIRATTGQEILSYKRRSLQSSFTPFQSLLTDAPPTFKQDIQRQLYSFRTNYLIEKVG